MGYLGKYHPDFGVEGRAMYLLGCENKRLQRFAFNWDHGITLTREAKFENQPRSQLEVIQNQRETL